MLVHLSLVASRSFIFFFFFFFNDTATTEIYTLSLHDALPILMLEHRAQPLLDDERREHLGERRRHGLQPRLRAAEGDVRVHGEAYPRQQPAPAQEVRARHVHRLAQTQPRLDAPFLTGTAVVVDDPLNPLLPHLALRAVGEDQRILDRNVDLVVEPVRHPKLERLARQLAAVHPLVEGMEVVIAALEHGPQPGGELVAHSSNSIASSPTTIPAASTCARSAELRHSM